MGPFVTLLRPWGCGRAFFRSCSPLCAILGVHGREREFYCMAKTNGLNRRALAMRSAVGPCWIHQVVGRINHGHGHDHDLDIPRDDQHNVIDTYARGTKSKHWDGGTVKNAFPARSTDDRIWVTRCR